MKNYSELVVWQKAMDLVVIIYHLTETFPKEEQYGLISQMRRASVSIPSNIAEGQRRSSQNDFKRFVFMAYGSGAELETQIEISKRLNYLPLSAYEKTDILLSEVMKMLNGLIQSLQT